MSAQRILFVTNAQAGVYVRHKRRWQAPLDFPANEQGYAALSEYLKTGPLLVTHVLVDFIEEEFRIEQIPHVRGSDHAVLLNRRLEQHYRGTPYRSAQVQGRRPDGRREDEVLMSALTNPELLKAWVDILLANKIPLRGIFSLPLLAGELFAYLQGVEPRSLLITRQRHSGARQAFFLDGKLKMSRLTPFGTAQGEAYADILVAEIDKMRRYLSRLKLLNRDDALTVYCLGGGLDMEQLRARLQDTPGLRYQFVPITDLAGPMKLALADGEFSDLLYLHLLLKRTPSKSYAGAQEKRYEIYRKVRTAMYGTAAVLGVVGAIWAGGNFINVRLMKEYAHNAQRLSGEMDGRSQEVLASMPQTPVSPENLKLSVDIAAALHAQQTLPHEVLTALSGGLQGFSQLRIQSVDWEATYTPDSVTFAAPGTAAAPAEGVPAAAAEPNAPATALYQVVLVKGRITPFDGNYRQAFETVNRFVGALKKQPGITQAEALEMPLNTSPGVTLSGQTGVQEADNKAAFILKAVMKVGHETP